MKIKYESDNDCVDCEHCVQCGRGDYKYPIAFYCDNCNEEVDEIYPSDWGYLCLDCFLEHQDKLTLDDIEEIRE